MRRRGTRRRQRRARPSEAEAAAIWSSATELILSTFTASSKPVGTVAFHPVARARA
jgi:hypothetical protein